MESTVNCVRLQGRIDKVRQRWMPDGSLSVIAALIVSRPQLGPVRASSEKEQPIPLRAEGKAAERILANQDKVMIVDGQLRRRFYRRDGEPCWGQVEIWVEQCQPIDQAND